jgi:hypothetical protein
MTALERRYRPAGSHIVHDRFDDEVVIINLNSGCYFSLRETAAEIWDLVRKGATRCEILAGMTAAYFGPTEEMERAVAAFLDDLAAENLVQTEESGGRAAVGPPTVKAAAADKRRPFPAPRLTKYEDQKELLLLDPIHEVGGLGWPGKK